MKYKLLFAISFFLPGTPSLAQALEPSKVFAKCYGQLTGKFLKISHPDYQAVKQGTVSPVDACLKLIDKAIFDDNDRTNVADQESLDTLKTLNDLHSSWFFAKMFPGTAQNNENDTTRLHLDPATAGLWFTKALFDNDWDLTKVLNFNGHASAIRQQENPNQSLYFNFPNSGGSARVIDMTRNDSSFDNVRFPDAGTLYGVREEANSIWREGNTDRNILHNFSNSGLVSFHHYLIQNIDEDVDWVADGALNMARKWSRNIFSDLLCRTLPAVRMSDVTDLVVPNSPTSFRQKGTCTQCHATSDQLASTIRNFEYIRVDRQNDGGYYGSFVQTNGNPVNGWPDTSTPNYQNTPATGKLYFRNYKGQLIDEALTSLADVGPKLLEQDDFFVCVASRYYRYFTGITVELRDPGDPASPALSELDQRHFNIVESLGMKLKNTKDLSSLIRDIISLESYQNSNPTIIKSGN